MAKTAGHMAGLSLQQQLLAAQLLSMYSSAAPHCSIQLLSTAVWPLAKVLKRRPPPLLPLVVVLLA
jgi:hypothetical protein